MRDGARNLFTAALVAAAVFVAGQAFAAYNVNPRLPTTYWLNSAGQWQTSLDFEARKPGVPARYVAGTVGLSAASLGRLIKGAMGGPVGITLTAAALLKGWQWDAPTQQFIAQDTPPQSFTRPPGGWPNVTHLCPGDVLLVGKLTFGGWGYGKVFDDNFVPAGQECRGKRPPGSSAHDNCPMLPSCAGKVPDWVHHKLYDINPDVIEVPGSDPYNVTDADLGQWLFDDRADLVPVVADDSIKNGYWPTRWTEMDNASVTIADAFQAVDDGLADSVQQALEASAQSSPQQQVTVEANVNVQFPVFCTWASIVCDFITWMQTDSGPPVDPVLPVEEVGMETWDSGLGSGSCPSPFVTAFMSQSITIEYDDYCWAATTVIYPILIMLSLIAGAMIVVGGRAG